MNNKNQTLTSLGVSIISFVGAVYYCDPDTTEQLATLITGVVTTTFAIYKIIKRK